MNILRPKTLEEKEARLAYVLISPTFLIVFGLVIYPVLYNIWISFHHVTLGTIGESSPFTGLRNYMDIAKDYRFLDSLKTTLFYSFAGAILSTFLGLIAALLLNERYRGRGMARAIMLFPYVAPVAAVAYIWRWLLNPVYGVLNWTLLRLDAFLSNVAGGLGLTFHIYQEPVAWLSEEGWAMVAVLLFQGWRYFPFAMLMILARLQAIDRTLYEAAEVDGANAWQKFRYITLPELRYVLATLFLLRLMWNFNKFDDIFLLTGGAAGTRVLPILTYQYALKLYDFGAGSATSIYLFLVLAIFMVFYVRRVLEW